MSRLTPYWMKQMSLEEAREKYGTDSYYYDPRFVRWEGATRISASPYRRALTLRQIEIAARQVRRPS